MKYNFPLLKPNEIECKATINENMIEISLHIQAATCTKILNNVVGEMNWEKEYTNGNKNCIVRIWDPDKNRMISKEDCGGPLTEIDGYKGQASNGFKRVCSLGWGIGIELYSQPNIRIPITDSNVMNNSKGNLIVFEKYAVKEIAYDDDRRVVKCIVVDSVGNVVFDSSNPQVHSMSRTTNDDDVVIPENADILNDENSYDDYENDLPDNTDGFDADDDTVDCENQSGCNGIDYRREIENEIKRTHVKQHDVLRAIGVVSFSEINDAREDVLDETLRKLKALPSYAKAVNA